MAVGVVEIKLGMRMGRACEEQERRGVGDDELFCVEMEGEMSAVG